MSPLAFVIHFGNKTPTVMIYNWYEIQLFALNIVQMSLFMKVFLLWQHTVMRVRISGYCTAY